MSWLATHLPHSARRPLVSERYSPTPPGSKNDVAMTTNSTEFHPSEANPFTVLGDALEAAADSVGDARADATASAKAAATKVRSGVSAGAYYTAYGASYGVVFGAVFLKELLPADTALRRGFERGVEDGAKAAIGAVARLNAAPEDLDEDLIDISVTTEAAEAE